MNTLCPKGHQSTDPDYCSECGAKIDGAPSGLADSQSSPSVSAAAGGSADVCPDCGTRRSNPSAAFCEICRYSFATGKSWTAPPAAAVFAPAATVVTDAAAQPLGATAATSSVPPLTGPAPANDVSAQSIAALAIDSAIAGTPTGAAPLATKWEAIVRADESLYVEPDPNTPFPTGEPERVYHLDFAENLIGRRSDRQDIHPEISPRDPGVSHRHAKLLRQADGGLYLLDVGSTNGTRLNGTDVQEGVKMPLKDGDEITLGFWTRITIHEARS
jgi:hypothetical protein